MNILHVLSALDGPNRCEACAHVVNLCQCHVHEPTDAYPTDEDLACCDQCEALGEYCADCRLDLGLDDDGAGEPGWRPGE